MIEHVYITADILDMEISLPGKIILALVASFDPQPLKVGNEELARILSCSIGSVNNTLKSLETKGIIKIINRQSPYRKILLCKSCKVENSTLQNLDSYFTKNNRVTLQNLNTELNRTKENYNISDEPLKNEELTSHKFILKSGKDWILTQAKYDEYKGTYPDINFDVELKKMAQWLRDNPGKRKTASGMPRFINSWLSRAKPDEAKLQQKKLGEYSQRLIDEHPTTAEEARELLRGIL